MTKRINVEASGIPVYCAFDDLVDITTLVSNPRNPNQHSQKQIELLSKIIKNQSWRAPITVSTRSGFIVRGHGRLMAAQFLGVTQVPIDRQDYATEAEEWADLIADNRIAELSQIDEGDY
ncbi:ParB/Srx family N-terminal domain-containing protein [Pelosinus sp. UFO1]|uniref:ParB/Srx family N-terminal domain-containing protein n=1 Tax=Pelosinus sp. UFO1 TaxID=484770 RepID=UPI0004D0DE9F|nr:ParB/Srx family N-terminal domain-containing protein [Pelosinus sp. UFO1]AIF51674.1 ParB domain protein nuclease [Pelosinus sp. UFO1]